MASTEINPAIEILPEHIIDQIKAGEVLERPASLLKELIENSLDAKSTEIHIHLIEQGMDLLSIEDNGIGMSFENLPYAFLRHATSKLKTFEDLYRLRSFGFRGEALASVAASARVTCTTQPLNLNQDGGKIIINGGGTELLIPQRANTHGTSIYIKDLFFNTPARLKFIKSKVSEKASLKKMIYSFVLAHPQVTFGIKWDEKEKEVFKAVELGNEDQRVAQVFYSKKTDNQDLVVSEQSYDKYKVTTYFTQNTYSTPQYRHHYLFVNKRFFQDKSLHLSVLRALESLWRFGESGHYFVEITTPPEDIDVNVHPNKTQIKFLRADVVYSLLTTSIKSKLAGLKSETSLQGSLSNSLQSEPQSLFTKQENQDQYLQNLNQASQNDWSSLNFDSLHSSSNLAYTNTLRKKYFNQYLLIGDDKPIFIDLKKWLSTFLTKNFEEFIANEEAPSPLLISEPFQFPRGKIDQRLEELKKIGLELDRLNPEFLILRTIPLFIPQALIHSVVLNIIHYFDQTKFLTFEPNSFKNYFDQKIKANDLLNIPDFMLENISEETIESSYAMTLSPEMFQKMFSL